MIDKIKARDLRQTPFNNPTQVFTNKINEVIDELNALKSELESVWQSIDVEDIDMSLGSLVKESAKKEEQSPLIQELTRNQAYAIEEAKNEAVEAYKRRLVEKLKVGEPIHPAAKEARDRAIKLVEETG